jgi:hypothetical protein
MWINYMCVDIRKIFAVVTRWKFKDSQDELLLIHTEPEFFKQYSDWSTGERAEESRFDCRRPRAALKSMSPPIAYRMIFLLGQNSLGVKLTAHIHWVYGVVIKNINDFACVQLPSRLYMRDNSSAVATNCMPTVDWPALLGSSRMVPTANYFKSYKWRWNFIFRWPCISV